MMLISAVLRSSSLMYVTYQLHVLTSELTSVSGATDSLSSECVGQHCGRNKSNGKSLIFNLLWLRAVFQKGR